MTGSSSVPVDDFESFATQRSSSFQIFLFDLAGSDLVAGHLSLDGRDVEQPILRAAVRLAAEPQRTAVTDDAHRIHPIRAESERPQQPRGRHFRVDLAVVASVFDLDLVV